MIGDDDFDPDRDARLAYLAQEADRLAALELELIDGMAAAEAERQRRHIRIAIEYVRGKPVKTIAEEHGCSEGHPGWCAKKFGVTRRLAGPAWARRKADAA